MILVGIPGDAEHEASFQNKADKLQSRLIENLQFSPENILRLPAKGESAETPVEPVTADEMRSGIADIAAKVQPDDCIWVFVLGHGHYDGKQAWLHVKGKDPSHEDFGRWFAPIRCQEQVFWLTHSSSGWFVKPLSREGRIVIAATAADDESNETEFPDALLAILSQPIEKLDLNKDNSISISELFTQTIAEVSRRFQVDRRLPTEHPQLDDNGDGIGSEAILPQAPDDATSKPKLPNAKQDGDFAKGTLVPYRVPDRKTPD